jgi:hypothetical protein
VHPNPDVETSMQAHLNGDDSVDNEEDGQTDAYLRKPKTSTIIENMSQFYETATPAR